MWSYRRERGGNRPPGPSPISSAQNCGSRSWFGIGFVRVAQRPAPDLQRNRPPRPGWLARSFVTQISPSYCAGLLGDREWPIFYGGRIALRSSGRRMAVLEVYNDATPNGLKVSIALEELALQYDVHRVFLGGEQLTPEFTKLNPNQKIPVLLDSDEDIVLTEAGAILLYLAEKTGKLLPKDVKGHTKTIELVFNQMSSLGPMLGQLLVFRGPWQGGQPRLRRAEHPPRGKALFRR